MDLALTDGSADALYQLTEADIGPMPEFAAEESSSKEKLLSASTKPIL